MVHILGVEHISDSWGFGQWSLRLSRGDGWLFVKFKRGCLFIYQGATEEGAVGGKCLYCIQFERDEIRTATRDIWHGFQMTSTQMIALVSMTMPDFAPPGYSIGYK